VSDIRPDRLRLLMQENRLSTVGLLARLRHTDGNERLARPTLSKVVNGSYRGRPSAHLVRGLAETLETTTDFLLGLSDEQDPNALALARKYAQADEEQLLIWLEEKSPELAEYMRALRLIPEAEQQYILDAMLNDIKAIHSGQALYTKVSADE
jgi:transcriptional regulator with XRE-family HTH domain